MFSESAKLKVQRFGRFLSNMVMPNIGAFIAWGLITALFIPTGWLPNESLGKLVGPMITYLLPLLIGYTGGKLAGGDRGAVVGAITTMGVIVGTDIPMFLGAMIVGPLGGWAIKSFDRAVEGKIKSGFEMLVNNFFRWHHRHAARHCRFLCHRPGGEGIVGSARCWRGFPRQSSFVAADVGFRRTGEDFVPEQCH